MTPLGALILVAAATAGGAQSGGQGVQIVTAQVQVEIVRPAIVRQDTGLEERRDAPSAQISRRGRTVLVEFQ
jgi:hypothetical protein